MQTSNPFAVGWEEGGGGAFWYKGSCSVCISIHNKPSAIAFRCGRRAAGGEGGGWRLQLRRNQNIITQRQPRNTGDRVAGEQGAEGGVGVRGGGRGQK